MHFSVLPGSLVYVGPHAKDGTLCCGVVLDAPVGFNNGTIDGHFYFACPDMHGVLANHTAVHIFLRVAISRATTENLGRTVKLLTFPHPPPLPVYTNFLVL